MQIQKRRRDDENKETEFNYRGRPVPQEKIDRWQKRQKSGEISSPHPFTGLYIRQKLFESWLTIYSSSDAL